MASTPRHWQPPAGRPGAHRWLLVLPFVWQLALVPVVNDVSWTPLSIPFPMLWQMAGVVLATVVIGVVFRADRRAGAEEEEAEFIALTQAAASTRSGGRAS